MLESVHEIIRKAEQNYIFGITKQGKYVDWSMHDVIEKIDAYLNSRHTSGETDSLGREKPFFNIVTAATNIWFRATDIDRKDIRVLPDSQDNTVLAFIATVHLQNWMKKGFGIFLNQWGRALARYGSSVIKFVEKNGELIASVVPWNRLIVDPVDFYALPRIEKFYKTPAQLRKMKEYDQQAVNELIAAVASRKTLDGFNKDVQNDFLELYEVHGELDTRLLQDNPNLNLEEDLIRYRQQMHVVSFVMMDKDEYKDFTLYKGKEKRDPYMITHLIEEDGRTLAIGAVEYLFDAQWMANHTVKNIKDTLDIASKLIFQTADPKFVGRNVLSAIETGDIFVHAENKPLTRIANDKPDISALMNFQHMWEAMGKEVTSTPDAMRGQLGGGVNAYRTAALLSQQAQNLFELMTENKGLAIETMLREFVIPFIKTKMDHKDELVAVLAENDISEIDSCYVPQEAIRRFNKRTLGTMMQGGIPSPYQADAEQQSVRQSLAPLGNKRFFKPDDIDEKTWKEALKDFEWEVTIEVTNEAADKTAVLQTLNMLLSSIASNPAILQDPNAKMIFNAILTETGKISPLQIHSTAGAQPPPPPPSGATPAAQGAPAITSLMPAR